MVEGRRDPPHRNPLRTPRRARYHRRIVLSSPTHSTTGSTRRFRLRESGAAAGVFVLLGTAVMAPFSVSSAYADDAAARFDARRAQAFIAAADGDPAIFLGVSDVAEAQSDAGAAPSSALYTLPQFIFSGVVNWGGYRFTYYSQQVLPGGGLQIPGRHVNAGGYVSDADGYIVLAGSAPMGTVFDTPFGYQGKIYDRGTVGNHLDVYIR